MGQSYLMIMHYLSQLNQSNIFPLKPINPFNQIQNNRIIKSKAITIRVECSKMKTRKSAAKRFKVTGTGRVVRRQCGKQHLNEKKTRNRKNGLSSYKKVSECDSVHVIKCLP